MLLWEVTLAVVCAVIANAAHTGSKIRETWNTLPSIDPLKIEEIKLDDSATHLGVDIKLTNISIFGLPDTEITNFHVDVRDHSVIVTLFVPSLEIISTYKVAGKIMMLPITGEGPGNITLKDVYAAFGVRLNFEKTPKDDWDLSVKEIILDFNTTRAYFKLDNLFDGDEQLGSTMNDFMNEHWKELVTILGRVISSELGDFLKNIVNEVGIPYDGVVLQSPKMNGYF